MSLLRIIKHEGFRKTYSFCLSRSWGGSVSPSWAWPGNCSWHLGLAGPAATLWGAWQVSSGPSSPSPVEGCAPSPLWGVFVWGLPPAARQRCAQYRRMSLWTWRRSSERVPSPPRRRHGEISPGQPCSQPEAGVCYLPTEGSLTRMRARLLQQDWVLRYWRISSAFLKLSPSIME